MTGLEHDHISYLELHHFSPAFFINIFSHPEIPINYKTKLESIWFLVVYKEKLSALRVINFIFFLCLCIRGSDFYRVVGKNVEMQIFMIKLLVLYPKLVFISFFIKSMGLIILPPTNLDRSVSLNILSQDIFDNFEVFELGSKSKATNIIAVFHNL